MSGSAPTQEFVPMRVALVNTGRADDLLEYLRLADYRATASTPGKIVVEDHPRRAPAARHAADLALFLRTWALMYPDAPAVIDQLRDAA